MKNNTTEILNMRLRPEARPIDWEFLNSSQKEAFRRVVYMLKECSDDQKLLSSIGRLGTQPSIELDELRSTRSVFLDGARGVGKSTVFLSLVHYLGQSERAIIPYPSLRFAEAIKQLRRKIIWLEPIDMDPLPKPFGLVPSLIARVSRVCNQPEADTGNYDQSFEALNFRLRTFSTDATLAWESNIASRKAHLDPEYYGEEMFRTNEARLNFSSRFNSLLEDVTKSMRVDDDSIFIATIDDFDTNPTACLQTLRMLRMLSVRKVFFLLLGDLQVLELMSDLSVANEIGELVGGASKFSDASGMSAMILKNATAISRNAVRKVLPINQRVPIHIPTLLEGMGHCPDYGKTHDCISLADLLANIPFRVTDGFVANQKVCGHQVLSLLGMIMHPGFQIFFPKKGKGTEKNKVKQPRVYMGTRAKGGANRKSLLSHLYENPGDMFLLGEKKEAGTIRFEHSLPNTAFGFHVNTGGYASNLDGLVSRDRQDVGSERLQNDTLNRHAYWAIHLFANSPRKLNDLWFSVRSIVSHVVREIEKNNTAQKTKKASFLNALADEVERRTLDLLANACRNYLLEESVFSAAERESISSSLTPSSIGDFNWSEIPLRLVAISSQPVLIQSRDNFSMIRLKVPITNANSQSENTVVRNLYSEIRAFRIHDWAMVAESSPGRRGTAVTEPRQSFDTSKEISPSSSSVMMLLHDVLRLGRYGDRFSSDIIPSDDGTLSLLKHHERSRAANAIKADKLISQSSKSHFEEGGQQDPIWCKWASTRYQGSQNEQMDLFWPPPPVASAWGLDIFRRSWNQTIDFVTSSIRNPRDRASALAFGWISAGCAVMDAEEPATSIHNSDGVGPTTDDWRHLFGRLNRIAMKLPSSRSQLTGDVVSASLQKSVALENWLQNVVVLMMPESGLPSHLMFAALFGLDVERYVADSSVLMKTDMLKRTLELNKQKYVHYFGQFENCINRIEQEDVSFNKKFWSTSCMDMEKLKIEIRKMVRGRNDVKDEDIVSVISNLQSAQTPAEYLEKIRFTKTSSKGKKKALLINSLLRPLVLRGFPLVDFMNRFATAIRARRGVRLGLLGGIAGGALSKRLYLSSSIHLSSMLVRGDDLFGAKNLRQQFEKDYASKFNSEDIRSGRLLPDELLIGSVFSGGGLVPHFDELADFHSEDPKSFPTCLKTDVEIVTDADQLGSK